jgi:hypothetical protein
MRKKSSLFITYNVDALEIHGKVPMLVEIWTILLLMSSAPMDLQLKRTQEHPVHAHRSTPKPDILI